MAKQPKKGSRVRKPKPGQPKRSSSKMPAAKKTVEQQFPGCGTDPFDNVEPWFWEVIDRAGRNPATLRRLLWDMSREELERFDSQFEWARAELSGEDFFTVHGYTRDQMQEFAAWIASQGRDYYARVFNNPELMPRIDEMKESSNFDCVVKNVYRERFGVDMPYTG